MRQTVERDSGSAGRRRRGQRIARRVAMGAHERGRGRTAEKEIAVSSPDNQTTPATKQTRALIMKAVQVSGALFMLFCGSAAAQTGENWVLVVSRMSEGVALTAHLTKRACDEDLRLLGQPSSPEEIAYEKRKRALHWPSCPVAKDAASWAQWRVNHSQAKGCNDETSAGNQSFSWGGGQAIIPGEVLQAFCVEEDKNHE